MPAVPHLHDIAVHAVDIDELGHVNNATYLTWVQAAVLSHWRALAPREAVAAYRWVAIKHEITYRRPAFLGDVLTATVVLERVRRESAYYETLIHRGSELIAEARSRWCCMDAVTLRPACLPQEIVNSFLSETAVGSTAALATARGR